MKLLRPAHVGEMDHILGDDQCFGRVESRGDMCLVGVKGRQHG
jgi:hypothetical protein